MRILVTGSRDWEDYEVVWDALSLLVDRHEQMIQHTVVEGGARGADSQAAEYAHLRDWIVETHPADWNKHGKRAGYIRNAEMVAAGADVCLAFIKNNSRGATMCANLAEEAGIRVVRFN